MSTDPRIIFIIPYRDREQQLSFFKRHMKYILEDMSPDDYKIYYVQQNDKREFNRGALKNIGFLAMRDKYPNSYQDITFVFNDVDTMPYTKNFLDYDTTNGVVKHFYGFRFALGGMFSIKGRDFERTRGFPNFWAWGFEDNLIQKRALNANLVIDRNQFYPYMDKNILQITDGITRNVNRTEFDRYTQNVMEGFQSIRNLQYTINEEIGCILVNQFLTDIVEDVSAKKIHDLRNGGKPFRSKGSRNATLPMMNLANNFKIIR